MKHGRTFAPSNISRMRSCRVLHILPVTRVSDLMAAHDPKLWETLQEFSQNLAIWSSRRMLLEETKLENGLVTYRDVGFRFDQSWKDSDFN